MPSQIGTQLRSAAQVLNSTGTISCIVDRPIGTSVNDFLIAFICHRGAVDVVPPAGWSTLSEINAGGNVTLGTYYKTATASETSTYAFVIGASLINWGWVGAYTGVNLMNPILDSASGTFTTSGSNFSASNLLDRPWAGQSVAAVGAIRTASGSATTWTDSNVELADISSNIGSGDDIGGSVLESVRAVADGSANPSFTSSQSQTFAVVSAITINPAVGNRPLGMPLNVTVEMAFGADPASSPASWTWTDVTKHVKKGINVRRGRSDAASSLEPSQCSFTLKNPLGWFTPHFPTSPYYPNVRHNTPVRVRVDPYVYAVTNRFFGFVDEWKPRWPGSPEYSEVEVSASGPMRRLAQGVPVKSALYRALNGQFQTSVKPLAYWPMEDASGSTLLASALKNGRPISPTGALNYSGDGSFPGSLPLPTEADGVNLGGFVPAYPAGTEWAVRWVTRIPQQPAALTQICNWETANLGWRIVLVPGTPDLIKFQAFGNGSEQLADSGTSFSQPGMTTLYGEPLFFAVDAEQNGANIDWTYTIWTRLGGFGKIGTLNSFTLKNIANIYPSSDAGMAGATIGHLAVSNNTSYASFAAGYAANGYSGEYTVTRFIRLCDEERVQRDWEDSPFSNADRALMGPQSTSGFLTLLQEIEDVENGTIWEDVEGQLRIRDRWTKYNRAVDIALDCKLGHVKLPFEPIEDDQRVKNDFTASRMGGSSARYSDEAHVAGHGLYSGSKSLNYQLDNDLIFRSQWEVHLGTVDEMRVPSISFDPLHSPDLIRPWLRSDIGARLTVVNLPVQYPARALDLFINGYVEFIDATEWKVVASCAPARPYEVFTFESTTLGRLETSGSTLASAIGATDTSLSVATTTAGDPLWTTASGDRPFDVEIGGEQMRVTNLTGSSSPQTFTVTRSVNGVVKSHASGATVKLWHGGVLAL